MRLPAIQFQKQRMTMPHKQRQMAQFTANRMAHLSRLQTVLSRVIRLQSNEQIMPKPTSKNINTRAMKEVLLAVVVLLLKYLGKIQIKLTIANNHSIISAATLLTCPFTNC